ncbi:MAG: DUF2178 domain-containing protein [Candidatus Staskawiczbacteria bacterium]|jgi:uncharacterized membrane protein
MTNKTFVVIRMLTAFFLAAVMAQAIIYNNYVLAIVAVVGAVVVIMTSKRQVRGVMVDERVLLVGGNAARASMSIFSVVGAGLMFILMFFRDANQNYYIIASVLAYSICALLLLYSVIFKYYEKQN